MTHARIAPHLAPRTPRVLARPVLGLLCVLLSPAGAHGIPAFARQYDVACSRCHVQPPKLNGYGEAFRRNGYRAEGMVPARRTLPVSIWASGRSDALHDERDVRPAVAAYLNKLEAIAAGTAGVDWLAYFVEWRPVSLETTRRAGVVELRDRSGRFEDLLLTASRGPASLTIGQYRQVDQVDVSLRLGLSEPLVLSASLPGDAAGLPTAADGTLTARSRRRQSLRAFSPSGRSPAVRLAWDRPVAGDASWTTSVALPFPGEFSIPLTEEARTEASNEFELRPKGIVVESFVRRGLTSVGGHVLYGDADRFLANAVITGRHGDLFWTAIAGVQKASGNSGVRGRWSLEGEYLPHYLVGVGGRIEDRAGDGAQPAFVPWFRAHFPGSRHTFYVAVERRFQQRAHATLVEIGTVF
jgi:hypothetical protein